MIELRPIYLVFPMQRWLLILVICSGHLTSWAQVVQGRVEDARTHEVMYPVTVQNLNTQVSTLTRTDGSFTIRASVGDELQFSNVGYKKQKLLVGKQETTLLVTIKMQPEDYQLKELVFKAGPTAYQRDSAYRQYIYQDALDYKRAGVMSPVSLMAELLSGKSAKMKAFKKDYKYWEEQHFIDTRYTSALVQEQTGLSGDTLIYFMNSFPMPYDYARTATPVELKMWIRNNFKNWRASGSPYTSYKFIDSLLEIR